MSDNKWSLWEIWKFKHNMKKFMKDTDKKAEEWIKSDNLELKILGEFHKAMRDKD